MRNKKNVEFEKRYFVEVKEKGSKYWILAQGFDEDTPEEALNSIRVSKTTSSLPHRIGCYIRSHTVRIKRKSVW